MNVAVVVVVIFVGVVYIFFIITVCVPSAFSSGIIVIKITRYTLFANINFLFCFTIYLKFPVVVIIGAVVVMCMPKRSGDRREVKKRTQKHA